jgi:hypothetical protein
VVDASQAEVAPRVELAPRGPERRTSSGGHLGPRGVMGQEAGGAR